MKNSISLTQEKTPYHLRLATYLSCVEIGVGGLFHAFKIPLTGYCLSLHQIFCLSRAQREVGPHYPFSPIMISFIAGLLKVLTPVSKKITPFIALTLQGLLFNLGIMIGGQNIIGHCMGAALASMWGFIQPLLWVGLIFGTSATEGLASLHAYCLTMAPWLSIYGILWACVLLKILLALMMVFMAFHLSPHRWSLYQNFIFKKTEKYALIPKAFHQRKSLFRQIMSFWFLVPLFLSLTGILINQGMSQSLLYTVCRSLGLYFLLLVVINAINIDSLLNYLQNSGYNWISDPIRQTINSLKQQADKL